MTNVNDTLHFIMTGGTIDSYYDGIRDTVTPFEHSFVPQFMKLIKTYDECVFTEACMKDSRELDESDRRKILEAVSGSSSRRIIVTHGTYTIPETARYLKENLGNHDKTVIIVGSMIPLAGVTPTDAGFNLGFAVAESKNLPAGIYACMNGTVFASDSVRKDVAEGRFSSFFTK
ncbi:MAG: asparaginase [Candidatus Moranbacteria bacterium]|nr:asparaginase [Candidatus Moranbacteria bacterium]